MVGLNFFLPYQAWLTIEWTQKKLFLLLLLLLLHWYQNFFSTLLQAFLPIQEFLQFCVVNLNSIKGMSINCMSMCVKIQIWKKKKIKRRRRTTTSILHLKKNYLNFNRLTFGVSNKIKWQFDFFHLLHLTNTKKDSNSLFNLFSQTFSQLLTKRFFFFFGF